MVKKVECRVEVVGEGRRCWWKLMQMVVGQKDSKQSALDQHEARSTFGPPLEIALIHASLRSVPKAPAISSPPLCLDQFQA